MSSTVVRCIRGKNSFSRFDDAVHALSRSQDLRSSLFTVRLFLQHCPSVVRILLFVL
jgi:hypothetical protein